MNESHCATARKGTLERSSRRPVGTPDYWRHLCIINGNLLAGRPTVGGDVDFVWQLGHVDLKAVLHVIQGLGVSLVRHESYGQTFGSKSTCTGNLTGGDAGGVTLTNTPTTKKKQTAP